MSVGHHSSVPKAQVSISSPSCINVHISVCCPLRDIEALAVDFEIGPILCGRLHQKVHGKEEKIKENSFSGKFFDLFFHSVDFSVEPSAENRTDLKIDRQCFDVTQWAADNTLADTGTQQTPYFRSKTVIRVSKRKYAHLYSKEKR